MCENKDFCNILMPSEYTNILQLDQYQKSDKAPFFIYANFECLIEKIDGCRKNPGNLFTTKVGGHTPSSFSASAISPFKSIENKHYVYRGKDCMKKFCESLREHTVEIANFKK